VENLFKELDSFENRSVGLELDIGALEGLKKMPVDVFDSVYLSEVRNNALVLCVDVRNFSDFLCSHAEDAVFKLIKEFTSNLLSCINQFGYGCSYYKLMGDGAFVIWDETNEKSINEALSIFDSYTEFLNEELFKPFEGLGLGGALVSEQVFKYEISAELSELKYRDYVGYGINLACRLQALAQANELVLNEILTKSGGIPFRVNNAPEILKEIQLFKGLKEDDRKQALFYDR
jgi:class 3 adenylate cyclase